jgi:hemoglobin
VLTVLVAGCKESNPSSTQAAGSAPAPAQATGGERSLYERLGGEAAIKAVVDEFVANVGADPRINKFFANANLDHLKAQLVNQIGQATGGPQKYTGRDMKTAHAGMGIDGPAFDALVDDLMKALTKFNVADRDKAEMLGILSPMRGDIVEK